MNVEFVGEVEKRPELYDYTNPSYGRKDVTEKAWVEIGRKFNLTGPESKEKWRNLRNAFVKKLKPPASGSSTKHKKTYYLSEAMQFTLPFIKVPGLISGNLLDTRTDEHIWLDDSTTGDNITSPESVDEVLQDDPVAQSPPPPAETLVPHRSTTELPEQVVGKRKRGRSDSTDDRIAAYFSAKQKYVEDKRKPPVDHVNQKSEALKMFLLSLLPDLESLPPIELRAFKRKTLILIEELSDAATLKESSFTSHHAR